MFPGLLSFLVFWGLKALGPDLGRNAVLTHLPGKDEVVQHMCKCRALSVVNGEDPEEGPPTGARSGTPC